MSRIFIFICFCLILLSCIALYFIPSQQRRIFLLGVFPPVILIATPVSFEKWDIARADKADRVNRINKIKDRFHRVIHELSKVSFEVFIWHAPLMAFEKMIIRVSSEVYFERTYGSMILFTMCVWLFSLIMYKYVETPINKLFKEKEGERS